MNTRYLRGKFGGAILSVSLLMGIGCVAGVTASAQDRDRRDRQDQNDRQDDHDNRDWNRGGNRDRNNDSGVYRSAQNQGYQDGLSVGANDAARWQRSSPQRSRYYRNADSGYNSSNRNRGQYKQAYREGFIRGYQEGYNRDSNNNGRYHRRDDNRRRRDNGRQYPFSS